uniref:Uncharacterized protein n=1 Tax=Nitrosopumivirus cobalaminus TaxID=3158414 RepID=A0AAU7N483_9VIRU
MLMAMNEANQVTIATEKARQPFYTVAGIGANTTVTVNGAIVDNGKHNVEAGTYTFTVTSTVMVHAQTETFTKEITVSGREKEFKQKTLWFPTSH